MLRKLRIFYRDNKTTVWLVIGIVIFIYVIIRIINAGIRNDTQEEMSQTSQNNTTTSSQTTYLPSSQTPVVSDTEVSEETLKNDTNVIEQFVQYGNENNVEEAYNLLSQECKEEVYKTIEEFYNQYFSKIFNSKRSYDIETWDTTTAGVVYKMKYLNNVMATGKVEEQYTQDYITVIKENDSKKLNINQFIRKYEIGKETEEDGLKINVLNRYSYYDYEEYEILVTNNSEENVVLDTKDKTNTVYVKGKNGVKYTWLSTSVSNEYLSLNQGENRTIRIKFNKQYNSNNKTESVCFTDIRFNNTDKAKKVEIGV